MPRAKSTRFLFVSPRTADAHTGKTHRLYFLRSGRFLKIGIAKDIEKRVTAMRTGNPHGIEIAAQREVPKSLAFQIEQKVHAALHAVHHQGECFDVELEEALRIADMLIGHAFEQDAQWALRKAEAERRGAELIERAGGVYGPEGVDPVDPELRRAATAHGQSFAEAGLI